MSGDRPELTVELLYFEGCPHWREAEGAIAEAARRVGVDVRVHAVAVEDLEEAAERRFLGSPTVRVAGRDVEPEAERRDDFTLACRLYDAGDGRAGTPPLELIVEALERAAAESQ